MRKKRLSLRIELSDKDIKRFCSKIWYNHFTGCWDWVAGTKKGYGMFGYKGKIWSAYRLSYMFFRGEISEEKELDHICCSPKCVNPYHLQQVTKQEHAKITLQRRRDPDHHNKLVAPYLKMITL